MDLSISTLFGNNKLKDLICKVSITIIYCRVLYKKEILFINIKDIIIIVIVSVEFLHSTKCRYKGFKFEIQKLVPTFKNICTKLVLN